MNRSTDDLDDLPLPQRPRRPDPRAEMRGDMRASARADLRDDMVNEEREFTLSTGTVLGLFFGLALICAVFFGFGYSMGHKSAVASAVPVADATAGNDGGSAADALVTSKPSAASPAIQAIPSYQGSAKSSDAPVRSTTPAIAAKPTPLASNATSVTVPMDAAPAIKAKKAAVDPDGQIVEDEPKRASTRPAATPAATATATPLPTAGTGTVYVQISAVSHKEDADTLMAALRRRGYSVFTRTSDADKLIHVQVGPYANKKDAEVMRQKLLGDGYNAIIK